MAKDYYDTLGVKEDSTTEEIKRVYRELAKKYHPDANKGDPRAESRFKDISEAYNVLSKPDKRKQYDQMRKLGAFGSGADGFDFSGFDFNNAGRFWNVRKAGKRKASGFSIEDLFGPGGFGLGDIFGDVFDRGDRVRRERWGETQEGKNLNSELRIPFMLSITGGRQLIDITREEACASCRGTGAQSGSNPQVCPTCGGQGTISMSQGFFAVNRPCPNCYGRGRIIKNPCTTCNGTGEVRTMKRLAINIPPGIKNGSQLKLKGQGQPGIKKGSPGDLYVTIIVEPHRFFSRRGDDIFCEVPIDIIKAIRGTKVRIKTVSGKKVELKIPPATKDGRLFKLKGMGVVTKNSNGDQYVVIRVIRRSNLTEEEKRIIREFENNGKVS